LAQEFACLFLAISLGISEPVDIPFVREQMGPMPQFRSAKQSASSSPLSLLYFFTFLPFYHLPSLPFPLFSPSSLPSPFIHFSISSLIRGAQLSVIECAVQGPSDRRLQRPCGTRLGSMPLPARPSRLSGCPAAVGDRAVVGTAGGAYR
jgi:hypothetical protein